MCLQFGEVWIWTSASARCERRRPFFDLDSLTFGSAIRPANSTGCYEPAVVSAVSPLAGWFESAGEAGLPRGTPSVYGGVWDALSITPLVTAGVNPAYSSTSSSC